MNKTGKCSLKELKDVWEKFGWVVFNRFEDYVAEVRKVEFDLQEGEITLKKLKDENDKKIHLVQTKLETNDEATKNSKICGYIPVENNA